MRKNTHKKAEEDEEKSTFCLIVCLPIGWLVGWPPAYCDGDGRWMMSLWRKMLKNEAESSSHYFLDNR